MANFGFRLTDDVFLPQSARPQDTSIAFIATPPPRSYVGASGPVAFRDVLLQYQAKPAFVAIPSTLPPPVAGMAWHKAWESPRFRAVPVEHPQAPVLDSQPPAVFHVGASGPTAFRDVLFQYQGRPAFVAMPSGLPAPVSGMAWFGALDLPVRMPPIRHQTVPGWPIQAIVTATIQDNEWLIRTRRRGRR